MEIPDPEEYVEEAPMSLEDVEKEMIKKALERHHGKRKSAAKDLSISERTLYRKIKEYGLENIAWKDKSVAVSSHAYGFVFYLLQLQRIEYWLHEDKNDFFRKLSQPFFRFCLGTDGKHV